MWSVTFMPFNHKVATINIHCVHKYTAPATVYA